jgi:hypothetical protein
MSFYRIFGLGLEQDVDLPEARWQFHMVKLGEEAWGVDEQGRYDPVRLHVERGDYRVKVSWPMMDDVPEEIRWKMAG